MNTRHSLLVLGVLTFLRALSVSHDAEAADVQVFGRLALDSFRKADGSSWNRLEVNFAPRIEAVHGDWLVVAEPELRLDPDNPSHRRLRPRRLYGQTRLGSFDLRVGNQIVAWGQMDALRPIDRINPRDYYDFIDNVTLEIPALRLRGGISRLELDAVVAPFFFASELPDATDCPWSLRRGLPQLSNGQPTANDGVQFGELDHRGATAGVRLTVHTLGTDLSATYVTGRDNVPVSYEPIVTEEQLYMRPLSPRQHVFGIDFARAFGQVVVRSEAAYVRTSDPSGTSPLVDDPYVQVGTGAELLLSGITPNHDFSVLAEFHLDREVGGGGPENTEDLPSIRHFYKYATFTRLSYRSGMRWEMAAQTYVGLDSRDLLLRPEFAWRPNEGALILSLRADVIRAGNFSFLGPYADNDRIGMLMTYEF